MKPAQEDAPISFCQMISSSMTEAESLCLKIRHLLQTNHLGAACFTVELLVRECLANAIKHGNRSDSNKQVVLRLSVGREWIRLQVSDEGPGFAWRKALQGKPDPTISSGRGLQLYTLYSQRVRFNRCGNQITLWIRKKNQSGKDEGTMAAYEIERKDRQGWVKLTGDLTAVLVPDLQAGLKEMLNKGADELVFDLENTSMLDSSGMGLLIAAANSLTRSGGKIRVTNVCPDIFRLLQSMRLTARLNVSTKAE
jgi:anti-anti-sigma factor